MTSIQSHDFEESTYQLDGWDGTTTSGSGVIALATDQVHHGSQSSKSTWNTSGSQAYCYKNYGDQHIVYIRFYCRIENLPINYQDIYFVDVSDANLNVDLFWIRWRHTAEGIVWRIVYRTAGGYVSLNVSESPMTAKEWRSIGVMVHCSTVDGQLDGSYALYVDGSIIWSVSNVDTDSTTSDTLKLGLTNTSDSQTNAIWMDCVEIADTYPGEEVPTPLGLGIHKLGMEMVLA